MRIPLILVVSVLALVAFAGPGPAVAQPGAGAGNATAPAGAGEMSGPGRAADIRVPERGGASTGAPSMTRDSELDGSPLGWPLTLGLILLAVLLLGYVPWRIRRAAQSRRATA